MNPDTAKQLAAMGDIKANKEKLAKAIEFAKKNPDHPDSVELRNRLERGMFNKELEALGKKPFPVEQPKIDLAKATQGTTTLPALQSVTAKKEQGSVGPFDVGISGASFADRAGDIQETFMGAGKQLWEAGKDIVKTAKSDDRSLAEKAVMIGGRAFGGAAGAFGEVTTGIGKLALTQEAEDSLKAIVGQVGQTVSETEIAKGAVNWYENLDENDKDMVDAAGGFASVLAELIGVKGTSAVARGAKEGLDVAAPVIKGGVETAVDVTQAGARKVDDLFTTSNATLEKRIQEQFQKGVKPTIRGKENLGQVEKYKSNAATAVEVITKNKDNLKFTDDVGEVIQGRTPETLQEFSDSITQTKEKIFKEYDSLARSAEDQGLKIKPAEMSNELDVVINDKALQLSNPEAVSYAKQVKDRFSTAGELTATEAQNVIKNYNNSLQAFYRNPTPEGLTRNAVDALMVNKMREALDKGIEGLTGEQYQLLKNQYGALRTIEKDVLNATLRDARKNTAGLIDFTDILSGGQLVTSLASMSPAGMAGAATQMGIKRWLKYLNDPNTQIKKMFQTSAKLEEKRVTPGGLGAFEESVTNPAMGMSIRSTVTPAKVAASIDAKDVDLVRKFLNGEDTPEIQQMLETMGIAKTTREEQAQFLKDMLIEAEQTRGLKNITTQ